MAKEENNSPTDDLSHILTHLGENRTDYFQAIAPPIIQTSNFAFPDWRLFAGHLPTGCRLR